MRTFLVLLLVLISATVHGAEKVYYKFPYFVVPNDSLAIIYKRFVYPDRVINEANPAWKRTVKENPKVTDWVNLKPGTQFNLFVKIVDMDKDKYLAYLDQTRPLRYKAPTGLKLNVFYMASQGQFTQSNTEFAEISSYQNSPATLGSALSYFPKNSRWSYSSSAYISYLMASGSNLDNTDINLAPEIGVNGYGEYKFVKKNITGYLGLDYEGFNTFDLETIQKERRIAQERNTIIFGTVGLASPFEIFRSPFYTRLSYAKSITGSGGYEGHRVLWYLNKKIAKNWFVHSLVKYHLLDGPSELKVIRYGLGFGYIFF